MPYDKGYDERGADVQPCGTAWLQGEDDCGEPSR